MFFRKDAFETCISNCSFTELICLPDEETITADTIACPLADPICVPKLYYTKEEYRLHLESILYLMEKHKNYNVFLSKSENISALMLYAKDGIGVLMSKMDS
ncbi:MAG: hypothetical protein VB078_09950 [Clostridiaceae bacterium]|nr:hypothetical protein [Clostridiaceae bacterium]